MNKSAKLIIAFAAGAVAGVLTGILIAPAKGADTRKKLAAAGKRVCDSVSEVIGACGKNTKAPTESGQES